jgi:methylated-DNA-protein-cysteine methyltransferase related protein
MAARFGGIAMDDSPGMDCVMKKKVSKKSRNRAGKTDLDKSSLDQSPDPSSKMRIRIESAIRRIPRGKVSTYGAIARAAGLPGMARQVAQVLHRGFDLPWQRVLGAGGEIKLRGDSAIEQRLRLEAEGVRFRGRKVDMKQCEFKFLRGRADWTRRAES